MRQNKKLISTKTIFLYGLNIWIFLQSSRFIALALIGDINSGVESAAWMYPAYLDLFAAVFAIPLVWAIIKKPGVTTWALLIMYLAISIVDHGGNFVTTALVGAPSIVQEGSNPVLIPGIMTLIDTIFLAMLLLTPYRNLFFEVVDNK